MAKRAPPGHHGQTVPRSALALLIALSSAVLSPARVAHAIEQPVIDSIEGDKIVVIKTPSGSKVGYKGTPVNVGDRVKTGARASAKVLYPDGSKLLIGKATEVEIQESTNGQQFNELHSGEVRGIIKKARNPDQKAPPRFIIRTRSAVMGVRGTDFVFDFDQATSKTELRTLDGAVEVARNEAALMEGKGFVVRRDEMLSGNAEAIQAPQKFDRRIYDKMLEISQPQMVAMAKSDPEIAAAAAAESVEEVSSATPEGEKSARSRLRLLNFQAGSAYYRQNSGGETITGQLSWDPIFEFLRGIVGVRGHLGVLPLKSRTQDKTFMAKELALLGSVWLFEPMVLEAGIGGQDWGSNGPGGPMATAQFSWLLGQGDHLIERWYVGASFFDQDKRTSFEQRNKTWIVRAGVGIQF
jgi:hypothetical protein